MTAKRILISIASLFFFAFLAFLIFPEREKVSLPGPLSDDDFVVVMHSDTPGCFSVDGSAFGYHYDILSSYAGQAGLTLRLVTDKASAECEQMLRNGQADVVVYVGTHPAADAETITAYHTTYSIIAADTKGGRSPRTEGFSFTSLAGKRVLMSSDFCHTADYDAFMDSVKIHNIHPFVSSRDAIELSAYVLAGDYDYFICENTEARVCSAFTMGLAEVYGFAERHSVNFAVSSARPHGDDFSHWFADYVSGNEHAVLANLYQHRGITPQLIGKLTKSRTSAPISEYDAIMQRVCDAEGIDWRLMSAICYNESRFKPDVVSRSGARGLMQIMPIVARHFGIPRDQIMDPETNIMLAGKLIKEIERSLKLPADIPDADRMSIILASYNGGIGHIQDARRLARKYGGNANSWASVSAFLKCKSQPEYSGDAVVRNGAFRGSGETIAFVNNVMSRYDRYCSL